MRIEIIGIQEVRYTSKKTGREVTGQKIHFTYDSVGINGVACDTAFLTGEKTFKPDMELPQYAELYYNKYGSAEKIILAEPK